jgi:multiple sugar transport system substrate-binding protein
MQIRNYKVINCMLTLIIILPLILTGCSKPKDQSGDRLEFFGEPENEYGNIIAPFNFDWKLCEGIKLNFICEDNVNANILSKEVEKFTKVTGIRVNVKRMDFNTLEEKINLEFISKTAQYDLIYVDPYKTLNRFYNGLEDLNKYENDDTLPHIVGGLDSFSKEQLQVCSYFENTDKVYSIPFDSTTMILFYRKDIFDQYRDQMTRDLGFQPDPVSPEFTWDQFTTVSKWINDHIKSGEVKDLKSGSLTMSAKHNSIYTAFSSVLGSYGGDYFINSKVVSLGTSTSYEILSRTPEFITALQKFKEIVSLNPDNEEGYTWDEVANAFTEGETAMMINWDENISAVENSQMAGKVGYSILPKGSVRSSNIYGGSGIGINSYANSKKKLAAWLFIVWATSPQVQMKSFLEKDGGTLPTRTALIEEIDQKYSKEQPQVNAMIMSQKAGYAYYRPKMKNGNEFEDFMISNLFEMATGKIDVRKASINIKSQWTERR